jgi:hypothetical protein
LIFGGSCTKNQNTYAFDHFGISGLRALSCCPSEPVVVRRFR